MGAWVYIRRTKVCFTRERRLLIFIEEEEEEEKERMEQQPQQHNLTNHSLMCVCV